MLETTQVKSHRRSSGGREAEGKRSQSRQTSPSTYGPAGFRSHLFYEAPFSQLYEGKSRTSPFICLTGPWKPQTRKYCEPHVLHSMSHNHQ